jgi:hypothetical protein
MPSRIGIEAAIESLVAKGEVVSVRKIRKALGGTGSHDQILPVLAAWREAQRAQTNPDSPVPVMLTEAVVAFVSQCWGLAEVTRPRTPAAVPTSASRPSRARYPS